MPAILECQMTQHKGIILALSMVACSGLLAQSFAGSDTLCKRADVTTYCIACRREGPSQLLLLPAGQDPGVSDNGKAGEVCAGGLPAAAAGVGAARAARQDEADEAHGRLLRLQRGGSSPTFIRRSACSAQMQWARMRYHFSRSIKRALFEKPPWPESKETRLLVCKRLIRQKISHEIASY